MFASAIAILCYSILFFSYLFLGNKAESIGYQQESNRTIFNLILLNGVVAHFFVFLPGVFNDTGLNLSFLNTLIFSGWVVGVVYLISLFKIPLINIGLLVLPSNITLILIYNLVPHHISSQPIDSNLAIHLLTSLLAFAVIIIAAIQALSLSIQAKALHEHHQNPIMRHLPPFYLMEKTLHKLIQIGFALLTLSLLSGFIFLEDLFAQHVAHKTILSIIAWVIFGLLIVGRNRWGWQSKTLIRTTIAATAILMIGFLGSKLVLQLIYS
jgi:ABC-type uncharacterized transport system permease subunit